MKKYFKEGQTVYCPLNNQGEVISLNNTKSYPVLVKFLNGCLRSYTLDGRGFIDSKIILSQNPIPEIVNKPLEDTYIPFTFEDDLLGIKVKYKSTKEKMFITYQSEDEIQCGGLNYSYYNLLEDFEFLDGKPCGKLA